MPNELQVVISVLTAGKPEEVSETYLQQKLDLSPSDFVQQYHSFSRLLKVASLYCFQTLKAELEVVWQLTTDTLHKLFYSLIVIQRPENQKRRRYLEIVERRLPLFAEDLRMDVLDFVQDHFRRLLIKAQKEGLLKANLSPAITADRLWQLNASALLKAVHDNTKAYWLNEVVLELWPLIQQLCTPKGEKYMTIILNPSYQQTFNHYGRQDEGSATE
ncbi:hypothetical protein [Lewinella sp. LCG006]|uniref:hypothetical protein n=1 Tax=Lewinella sp. LCG006 TaxID=3231911 RepID=UPI0034602297